MAQQNSSKNQNISEVVLNVTLNGLANFVDFQTDEFFVSGTPWYMRFSKEKIGRTNYLAIHLHSNFEHSSDKTHIDATFNAILTSSKANVHQDKIYLDAFCTENPCWGLDKFITWTKLFDRTKGFIVDDHCQFVVKVKVTKVLNADDNELLHFVELGETEDGYQRKFRLTMFNFQNTIGVCSPNINFDGSQFRIAVSQIETKIVITICKTGGENSCYLTSEIKLLSFDPNIQPIRKEIKNLDFSLVGSYDKWDSIDWDDLIDPQKKFIQDDSFVIEVKFKAELGAVFSSCLICSEDLKGQPISSIKPCNHMFCTACVRRRIRENNKCPKCNGEVRSLLSYVATE